MKYYAGLDIGSTTTKAVIIDDEYKILGSKIVDTSFDRNQSGEDAMCAALAEAGLGFSDLAGIYTTGYGRKNYLKATKPVPEVICHGKGTAHLLPGVRTIIDIGGQDAKLLRLDTKGNVLKFEMNDKCAAGTGRFFEVLSGRLLKVSLDELGDLALKSTNPSVITSLCTVFAETEIISLLSKNVPVEDISMGMLDSIVRRIYSMGAQAQLSFMEPIALSGGSARNKALKVAFEKKIGKPVHVMEMPQLQAAMGAALFAKEDLSQTE